MIKLKPGDLIITPILKTSYVIANVIANNIVDVFDNSNPKMFHTVKIEIADYVKDNICRKVFLSKIELI